MVAFLLTRHITLHFSAAKYLHVPCVVGGSILIQWSDKMLKCGLRYIISALRRHHLWQLNEI